MGLGLARWEGVPELAMKTRMRKSSVGKGKVR